MYEESIFIRHWHIIIKTYNKLPTQQEQQLHIKMYTSSSNYNKNSQGMLQNSTQRILQTSPTAATLKSFNHYGSSKQIPPLVSINGDNQKSINGHIQEQKTKKVDQQIRDNENNGGWGQGIVSKFKQIKIQKNRNMNMNNSPKRIEKVSENSPSKHVYNVNMSRRMNQPIYQSPPALISNGYKPIQSNQMPRNEAEHENNEIQKLQSVAQSVYLDLQQYSSIHKYESISPNYDDFQEDKEYVKYLVKNDEYGNPIKANNYRMVRMLPRQSINLQSQDSITKSYRNSSNIPNVPHLQLHTELSSPIKNFNQADLIDEGAEKIKMQESIHRMSTPTRQPNRFKTNQQIKYPYIAKYLSLQPQNNPIPFEQQLSSHNPSSPIASIPLQSNESQTKNINDNHKGENINQFAQPNIYSGQFKHVDELESLNSRNQNTYFNRLTLQVYQHYLGQPHAGKSQPNQNLSSILINTSSNHTSSQNALKALSNVNISSLKIYPYIENMNNYNINQNISLKIPQWLQNRSAEHTLRLILTKNTKLTQYLKYLSELQIKLKHKNTFNYLQKTQKRNDIELSPKQLIEQQRMQRQIEEQKHLKKKSITIYYDTEQDRKNSKQKSSNSNSKGKNNPNIQINNKNKSSKLESNYLQYPPDRASNRKQSLISNNSDNVQSLNVFNTNLSNSGYLPKNSPKPNNKHKNQLESIQSQDGQSNIYIKNDRNHSSYRIKTKEIEVLKILQTLLVKLSAKKCNVLVKDQGIGSMGRDDRSIRNRSQNYLSSSRRVESQAFGLNKWAQTVKQPKSPLVQKIEIQFEQYLQNNPHYQCRNQQLTCSTKMTTYSQKIKELTSSLQNKQKYVEEIKSSYDYIINNYIKTIMNLKNVNKTATDSKSNGSNNSKANSKQSLKHSVSNRTSKKTMKSQKAPFKNQSQQQNIIVSEQQYSSCEQLKQSQKDTHNKLDLDFMDNFRNSQPITFKMSRAHNDSLEEDWIGSANGTLDPEPNAQHRYWYSQKDQNI